MAARYMLLVFLGIAVVCKAANGVTRCTSTFDCQWGTQCCQKDGAPWSFYWYYDGGTFADSNLGTCGAVGQEGQVCFASNSYDPCTCDVGLMCCPSAEPVDPPPGWPEGFPFRAHTCQRGGDPYACI
ncbi:uncharacterized protein LOC118432108 [Branchiostoma floridae]|uniref:Uncharacterized protein LOC118432108 n=1 Tax=Branchiostoma floridae TaxID=7739 RepID=C3YLZ7_BRAFL|nr:uncharacterized protein LOC118432108 [Branchiostoma floridae]|eukprot:XP_002602579.1 hypothetical protein BRAFLDRAFT_81839 [Branchiostoma floridae]